jgi:SAM-dependent methyltransferase
VNLDLLIDLHKGNSRQGPGGEDQTQQALQLTGLDASRALRIADIGCGTGASTLTLARGLSGSIVAVDLFQEFLDVLTANAEQAGLTQKVETLACSMEELPFEESSFDLVWAEGAIYNMGFAKGLAYFKQFLKPGGLLAASEITWLTKERPQELQNHWDAEYPEIATASEKIKVLEGHGYSLKGYFPLPESCWLSNYYAPLENTFAGFLARHNSDDARAIVEAEQHEIALYKKYSAYYSYGFYIAQKL